MTLDSLEEGSLGLLTRTWLPSLQLLHTFPTLRKGYFTLDVPLFLRRALTERPDYRVIYFLKGAHARARAPEACSCAAVCVHSRMCSSERARIRNQCALVMGTRFLARAHDVDVRSADRRFLARTPSRRAISTSTNPTQTEPTYHQFGRESPWI